MKKSLKIEEDNKARVETVLRTEFRASRFVPSRFTTP